jgi:hypothetical protein
MIWQNRGPTSTSPSQKFRRCNRNTALCPSRRGPSLRSGFRRAARTPRKRLKFESRRVHSPNLRRRSFAWEDNTVIISPSNLTSRSAREIPKVDRVLAPRYLPMAPNLGRSGLIDAFVVEPAAAVHVEPFAVGFARSGVGAEAQDVAVEVFDLHFERPGIVCRRMADFCP